MFFFAFFYNVYLSSILLQQHPKWLHRTKLQKSQVSNFSLSFVPDMINFSDSIFTQFFLRTLTGPVKKTPRFRTHYTDEQKLRLCEEYTRNQYPTAGDIDFLLSLYCFRENEKKVLQTYFRNTRKYEAAALRKVSVSVPDDVPDADQDAVTGVTTHVTIPIRVPAIYLNESELWDQPL